MRTDRSGWFAYMVDNVVDNSEPDSGGGVVHWRCGSSGRALPLWVLPRSLGLDPGGRHATKTVDHDRGDNPLAVRQDDFSGAIVVGVGRPGPQHGSANSLTCRPESGGLLVAARLVSPSPGQQGVELLHGPTIDELGEDVGQIGLWIELVEFAGFNQRGQTCPICRSLVVASKQTVLSCEGDQTVCTLHTVGIHLNAAVAKEEQQAFPALEPVSDRLGKDAFLRHPGKLDFQPGPQAFDQRFRLRLPHGAALLSALSSDAVLDGVKRRDTFECLAGNRRGTSSVDIDKQPAPMRPAKSERDLAGGELRSDQLLIDLIAVALDDTGVARKQTHCVLAAPSRRVGVGDARWIRSGPGPVVARDGP